MASEKANKPPVNTIMNEPIHTHYAEVRDAIRDADLLLFRRRDRLTRLIAVAGRSQYVHAAIAGWWNDRRASAY